MFLIDWIEDNLDFEGVGVAVSFGTIVLCVVACILFGGN